MANSDKNILITPNISAATGVYPTIKFNGANNTPINLSVLDDGTISFSSTAGQLFSISDGLTGTIFSVNDISGIPSIEVLDTGLVKLNQYGGSTVFGASSAIQNGSAVNAKVSLSTGSATTPGLIVKGVASQTANLIEWQNSSGTTLGFINAEGSIQSANRIISPGDFEARGNSFHGNAPFSGATVNITTRATTQVGAIIRGVASQTGDLQQWQDSAGTALAKVSSNGAVRASVFANLTPGLSYIATNFDTSAIGIPTGGAAMKGLVIRGFVSQTANLQEWQDSSGTVLGFFASNGTLKSNYVQTTLLRSPLSDKSQIYTDADGNGAIRLDVGGPTQKGFIIRGAASQTADLQQWQDSAGTVLTSITSAGVLNLPGTIWHTVNGTQTWYKNVVSLYQKGPSHTFRRQSDDADLFTIGTNGETSVLLQSSSAVGLIVKGAASQTANLQEWQNSGGTVLAKVDKDGNNYANAFVTPGFEFYSAPENSGGFVYLKKETAAAANPGAGAAKMYFRDGTTAGTLKLVVRAGASGAETTILDNIPQS